MRSGRGALAVVVVVGGAAGHVAGAASVPCPQVTAPPGAVYLYSDEPTVFVAYGNDFLLDGRDHDYDGSPGPMPAIAGLATRTDVNTAEAIASLGGSQLDNIVGLGFELGPPTVPSVLTVARGASLARVDAFVASLLAPGDAPGPVYRVLDTSIQGNRTCGTEQLPQITQFAGAGLAIHANGNAAGAGIMIVEGDLIIDGTLDFIGLVIVRGNVRIGSYSVVTGSATVYGALWARNLAMAPLEGMLIRYSSQALALAEAVGADLACDPSGCGDGILDPGEECDDGNLDDGDCCSAVCASKPASTPCTADADACTADVCDGAGRCVVGEPVVCPRCLACDPAAGCPPPPICRTAERPQRARLVVAKKRRGVQRLRFAWRGDAIAPGELGDPRLDGGYAVCVMSDDSSTPMFSGSAGAGYVCDGGMPCWRGTRRGFAWRGGWEPGLRRIALRSGGTRKAAVVVTADGGREVLPPLPWPAPFAVEVRGAHGACWRAEFRQENVRQSRKRLVARGSPSAGP